MGIAVTLTAGVILWPREVATPPPAVVTAERWPVSDLPRAVFKTGRTGFVAVVALQNRPQPTDHPLVFEYRPGHPPELTPPTYRLHFDTSPEFAGKAPYTVEGLVDRFEPDTYRRTNGVPGVVVLRHASLQVVP